MLGRVLGAICSGGVAPSRAPAPLTPNTVEIIPTLGALSPRGGPVRDPVLTNSRLVGSPRRVWPVGIFFFFFITLEPSVESYDYEP